MHAWKSGGSHWKAWSSRLVSASLKVGSKSCDLLHMLSLLCSYIFAASGEEKDAFFDSLQQALSEISSSGSFLMLGDFQCMGKDQRV